MNIILPPDSDDAARKVIDLGKLDTPRTLDTNAKIQWETHNLRSKIALRLTYAVIALVIISVVAAIFFPQSASGVKEIDEIIIPLYGVVIGFYFGAK